MSARGARGAWRATKFEDVTRHIDHLYIFIQRRFVIYVYQSVFSIIVIFIVCKLRVSVSPEVLQLTIDATIS